MSDLWASDVPVSQPQPIDTEQPVQVSFGGFAFTTGGITHDLTDAEREDLFSPYFAPLGEAPRE